MKIRFAILLGMTFALLTSCQSQSQVNNGTLKTAVVEPKVIPTLSSKDLSKKKRAKSALVKDDDLPKIQGTDLTAVFAQAEKYFKAAQSWEKLKCQPKSGFVCTKWECPKREVFTYLIVDKKTQTIQRCEKDVCETYPAQIKQTGVFVNAQTEGPVGTLIRILGDSRYKEISSVGLDAYIANGNCEVVTN